MNEEKIIFRGSPSIWLKGGQIFLAILLIIGAGVGAFFLQPYALAFAALGAVGLIYLLGLVIAVRSTVYEVTTQRIRLTNGILSKRTDEMELYRVTDMTLVEPFTLRMLGKGNIELTTSDTTTPLLCIRAISGARQLREDMRVYIEECRDRKRVRVTEFE
ncbi:MAG: PH domain-containing protein [Verrucomicrobiales bacterium]